MVRLINIPVLLFQASGEGTIISNLMARTIASILNYYLQNFRCFNKREGTHSKPSANFEVLFQYECKLGITHASGSDLIDCNAI